jgi:hypothetical protein
MPLRRKVDLKSESLSGQSLLAGLLRLGLCLLLLLLVTLVIPGVAR